MKRKKGEVKATTWYVIIGIMTAVLLLVCIKLVTEIHSYTNLNIVATNETVLREDYEFNPANHRQNESNVLLTVADEKVVVISKQVPFGLIGAENGYVYYAKIVFDDSFPAYSYDIASGRKTELFTGGWNILRDYYFSENGTLYISADQSGELFFPIKGSALGESVAMPEVYPLCGKTYTLKFVVESNDRTGDVVICAADGTVERTIQEIPYGKKSLIPCDAGLLVHNEGQGDLLYLIEEDSGNVIELFTVECMVSISAVNVHGDNAYLSFKRYEKHGDKGMVRFENDSLEGTYRISLTDYSVEKLSDDIYNGLFIFDDTGIYACNEDGCIYKLDFDGQRILTLLE